MNDVRLLHTPQWQLDGDEWLMIVGNRTVAKIIANEDANFPHIHWLSVIDSHEFPDYGWHAVDFETLDVAQYDDFMAEIQDPNWRVLGAANINNFHTESDLIDLGDGVTIRGRSKTDIESLGFDVDVWDSLAEDWRGFGVSSFVLVAEHSFPKQPSNLIGTDTTVSRKARRAIMALRLAAAGWIGLDRMWVVRPARFNVGRVGRTSVGADIPIFGSQYRWTENLGDAYPSIYAGLAKLDTDGYHQSPGNNLAVALRECAASYDSWPSSLDSQLLDCTTALEALLGTDTEISFKLSFRVASLLAENDDKRSALLRLMKQFYDARSKVVHGVLLSQKQQKKQDAMLNRVNELQSIVRPLLRAFINLSATPNIYHNKQFWNDIDVALVNSTEREKLRTALGLKGSFKIAHGYAASESLS